LAAHEIVHPTFMLDRTALSLLLQGRVSEPQASGSITRLIRGAGTLYRRRGFGYLIYLMARVARLRLLYRFVWGPRSWRPARAIFDAGAALASRPAPESVLRQAGLLDTTRVAAMDATSAAALMDRAHAAGITGLDDVFARAVARRRHSAATPLARLHDWRGAYYLAARDEDRRRFNYYFGTALLTEKDARQQLDGVRGEVRNGYRDYAPIDFGGGLSFGQIASTDSGSGRWDFFNGAIVGPLVAGKRVLDLGCNNGSLTLMMLRAGAREVVAVELTEEIADVARLNAEILAWRDAREYRLDVITGDMRLYLTEDLGHFDVVTAFCSLYYVPEADMARIIRKAADSGATLILQANDAIGNLPAHTDRLHRLLEENGYPQVRVSRFPGFARSLLVGSSAAGVDSRIVRPGAQEDRLEMETDRYGVGAAPAIARTGVLAPSPSGTGPG
jgi:SAM-dependent methyltransferase